MRVGNANGRNKHVESTRTFSTTMSRRTAPPPPIFLKGKSRPMIIRQTTVPIGKTFLGTETARVSSYTCIQVWMHSGNQPNNGVSYKDLATSPSSLFLISLYSILPTSSLSPFQRTFFYLCISYFVSGVWPLPHQCTLSLL